MSQLISYGSDNRIRNINYVLEWKSFLKKFLFPLFTNLPLCPESKREYYLYKRPLAGGDHFTAEKIIILLNWIPYESKEFLAEIVLEVRRLALTYQSEYF